MNCGRIGVFVCVDCVERLDPVYNDFCMYCGRTREGGETCTRCLRKNGIDGVISFYFYNEVLQKCIHRTKYEFVKEGIRELFFSAPFCVFQKLSFYARKDIVVVPVPLHSGRKKVRGFNQAEVLGGLVSKILRSPIGTGVIRCKNTAPLAQSNSRVQRYLSIRNAFKVQEKQFIEGRNVLIIDDVVSSTTTIRELARTLKKAGAAHVFVFSLGRA